jgi:hypothetical protein
MLSIVIISAAIAFGAVLALRARGGRSRRRDRRRRVAGHSIEIGYRRPLKNGCGMVQIVVENDFCRDLQRY